MSQKSSMHVQAMSFNYFRCFLLGTIQKKNVELHKTLQVQSKSKHQKKEVKKAEEIYTDEDEYEDEYE